MDLAPLFEPIHLGPLRAANRVVMLAHLTLYADEHGHPSERLSAYYDERARCGVGLIVTESQHVHPSGGAPRSIAAHEPSAMARWANTLAACHGHGTAVVAQLSHHGPEADSAFTGMALWAPSAVANPVVGEVPRPMTHDDVAEVVDGFGRAARLAVDAGFDGIEVKVGHDGLLRTFLSPLSNLREDEYGGDLAGRLRLPLEVVAAVRAAVGPSLAVGVRLCLDERVPGGYGLDEGLAAARAIAEAGVDFLTGDLGTWQSMEHQIPPMSVPEGFASGATTALKAAVDVPVIGFGRLPTPAAAAEALASGSADLVGLARPLIADPEWLLKAREGRADEIRPCVACNQSCVGHLIRNEPIGCVHNPAAGRERRIGVRTLRRAPSRKVLVIGGGPAGLKVAEVAARRGHLVTVLERADQVGGQVALAARAPHREAWAGITSHLEVALTRAGVEVRTGVDAGPDDVRDAAPDVVVVATGASPGDPPFPVESGTLVADAWQVLGGGPMSAAVVLLDLGRGFEGPAVAEALAARGHEVHWVTPGPAVAFDVDPATRTPLLRRLARAEVVLLPGHTVIGAGTDGATLLDLLAERSITLTGASVVVTGNRRSSCDLVTPLTGLVPQLEVIGDAVAPRDVSRAIREADRLGRSL